jgi:hypothetical protein
MTLVLSNFVLEKMFIEVLRVNPVSTAAFNIEPKESNEILSAK